MQTMIYMDNNATTRVAPEVIDALVPFLRDNWGNPSSAYHFGSKVSKDIEAARERVAALIHADPLNLFMESRKFRRALASYFAWKKSVV